MSQELQLLIVCFSFLTLEEGVAEGLFRSLIPETSRKPGLSSPPTPVEMQIRPPQSFADLSAHAEAAEAVFLNVFVAEWFLEEKSASVGKLSAVRWRQICD